MGSSTTRHKYHKFDLFRLKVLSASNKRRIVVGGLFGTVFQLLIAPYPVFKSEPFVLESYALALGILVTHNLYVNWLVYVTLY